MAEKNEFAPGIYDRNRFEPIPTVTTPEKWKTVTHEHLAFKAGKHFDLRLLEPGTDNLHSWALRKMPKPGEKVLAVQQPTHAAAYLTYKGVIPKGYGAGAVNIHHKGTVEILNASPSKITFQRGGELFTLVKTKGPKDLSWLLLNRGAAAEKTAEDVLAMICSKLLQGSSLQTIRRD